MKSSIYLKFNVLLYHISNDDDYCRRMEMQAYTFPKGFNAIS